MNVWSRTIVETVEFLRVSADKTMIPNIRRVYRYLWYARQQPTRHGDTDWSGFRWSNFHDASSIRVDATNTPGR